MNRPLDLLRRAGKRGSIGSALNPSASSPPIPTHAPPLRKSDSLYGSLGGIGGEAIGPAPILLWYYGPSAPKDLYRDTDGVGWLYDAAGRFWEVFPPASAASKSPGTYVLGENGYVFEPRIAGPSSSGPGLLEQIGNFIATTVIPIAIGILTVIQPEIGIAAAVVYKSVAAIAAGARLSDTLMSALSAAAKEKIPSQYGKDLFDQGASVALNQPALKAARDTLDKTATAAASDALGLKRAFETGVALTQTKAIQEAAVGTGGILGSELGASGPLPWMSAEWNADHNPAAPGRNNIHGVYDFAVREGASPTDIAVGLFPTPAIGLTRLSNAIALATMSVDPAAGATAKLLPVPAAPLASSGQALSTGKPSAKGASSGPGLGTALLVVGGGYVAYKYGIPFLMKKFAHPGVRR